MHYECPNCHCDNQDMFSGMGENKMMCEACDHEFDEGDIVEVNPLNIQVQRMYRFDTDRPLKAFVDIIVNDALLIKGVRVMQGRSGTFVSMPREQARDQKWYDSVRCLTTEVRDQITAVVMEAYNEGTEGPPPTPPSPYRSEGLIE